MIQKKPSFENLEPGRYQPFCYLPNWLWNASKRTAICGIVLALVAQLVTGSSKLAAAENSADQDSSPPQTLPLVAPPHDPQEPAEETRQIPSPWPEGFPNGPWWNDGLFCGPNALYVLLRLHDIPVSMEDVHRKIEIKPGLGCTPEQLRVAGEELGLELEERFVPADQLLKLQRPFILHGAQSEDREDAKGHFWVVVGYDEGSQMLAVVDASSGIYRMIRLAQVEKQYSGWVVVPKVEAADSKLTIFRWAFFSSLFLVGISAAFLLLLDMRLKRQPTTAGDDKSATS